MAVNRHRLLFDCAGARLAGTVDRAPGSTGLLIVSGGNEVRSGAWAGQAQLAGRIAAAGHPVMRFERRGVGDSEGENHGYTASEPDIAAALACFCAQVPGLTRVVGFGNCDAATALALFAPRLRLDALVLANPWTVADDHEETPRHSPAAIRRRYAAKLTDPREWLRLLHGGIDLAQLARGLRRAVEPVDANPLAGRMRAGLAGFAGPVTILLAARDRTAELFQSAWEHDPRIRLVDSASHSFADPVAREWLFQQLIEVLEGR